MQRNRGSPLSGTSSPAVPTFTCPVCAPVRLTICSVRDPVRSGIRSVCGRLLEEEPQRSKSDLALMGVYSFTPAVHEAGPRSVRFSLCPSLPGPSSARSSLCPVRPLPGPSSAWSVLCLVRPPLGPVCGRSSPLSARPVTGPLRAQDAGRPPRPIAHLAHVAHPHVGNGFRAATCPAISLADTRDMSRHVPSVRGLDASSLRAAPVFADHGRSRRGSCEDLESGRERRFDVGRTAT